MKMKRLFKSALIASIMTILVSVIAYAETVVDFSDAEGFGISEDSIQINGIRVDTLVENPFDPAHPTIITEVYDVAFRFDYPSLSLIPDMGSARADSDSSNADCANVEVIVTDASTPGASALVGAHVSIESESGYTDENGIVNLSGIPEGTWEVTASATRYINGNRVVELSCDDNTVALSLSPEDNSVNGQIILTWGELPLDLDVHATGPDGAGGRFYVHYGNRNVDVASLEVDDRDSYGPEVIIFYPMEGETNLRDGLYRVTVHNYSQEEILPNSQASVALIFDGEEQRVFSAPPAPDSAINEEMIYWTVFELSKLGDSITIYPVNTYSGSDVEL